MRGGVVVEVRLDGVEWGLVGRGGGGCGWEWGCGCVGVGRGVGVRESGKRGYGLKWDRLESLWKESEREGEGVWVCVSVCVWVFVCVAACVFDSIRTQLAVPTASGMCVCLCE